MTPGRWVTTWREIPYRWLDMQSFEITHAGQTWAATREVRDGVLYVHSAYGSRSAAAEEADTIAQATLMLAEMMDERRTRKGRPA